MRFHCNARSRTVIALAAAAVPLLVGEFARGQSYSTPPVTVFTAVSLGYTSVTDGANSTSNVSSLIQGDNSVIVGYLKNSTTSMQQVYYLTPQSPYPNTPALVGLTDSGHLLSTSSSSPQLVDVSSTGLFVGNQTRLDSTGSTTTQLGQDVITSTSVSSPTTLVTVPLPTTVLEAGTASYSYTNTSVSQTEYSMSTSQGTDSSTGFATNAIGTGGIIAGTVNRYAGDANTAGFQGSATSLGTDGFYYNPSTNSSTAIGLSGGVYDEAPASFFGVTNAALMVHGNSVVGMAGSSATGFTNRYNSSGGALGYDSWMYNPSLSSQTLQIGLVGGPYTVTLSGNTFEETQVSRTNSLGQIAGKSYQPFQSTGGLSTNVAWLYTPSSTPGTASGFGTTSAGTYTQLGLTAIPSGTTLGNININPATSTTLVSNSNINFLNNQGHAAGTTNRYDANGNFEGGAAWYYNGTRSTDISPVDSIHQAVAGGLTYSSNTITAINNTGLVAAYATRVAGTGTGAAALGQDAYVYDSNTSQEYFVDPSHESLGTGNYELSYIGTLGDNGVAVGYYNTYSGTSSTVLSSTLFDWSETGGLQALATYAGSAAASSMAAYTASFEFGPNGTLYGPNTYGTSATSIVAYTVAVPEPTSMGLLAVGSLGLLRRRRRLV
jgi:hypothetical protein